MQQLSLSQKISWFFYRKGIGSAKPDYLRITKPGDGEWMRLAEAFIRVGDSLGCSILLTQVLQKRNFAKHPKRIVFLKLLGECLLKGDSDERERIVDFLEANPAMFSAKDESILGPLVIARRDSNLSVAAKAETALQKIRGDDPYLHRKDYMP